MTMILTPEDWLERRTLQPAPQEARHLPGLLRDAGLTVDLVLLTRDAATTLGRHLLTLRHGWPGNECPFGRILVTDLGSSDNTLEIAEQAGAETVPPDAPQAASLGPAAHGDGLVRALARSTADLLLVVPARLVRLDFDAVAALLGAFCRLPAVQFAQGFQSAAGSDLSRLLARPLLAALLPELSVLADPACPLLALRRTSFLTVPIARTCGYQPALAVEAWRQGGLDALAQVRIPPLEWGDQGDGDDAGCGFRTGLALLESLRRARRLSVPQELGHLSMSLVDTPVGGLLARTHLDIFPWRDPLAPPPRTTVV